MLTSITPENTEFVLLSFEGPDGYSLAGGLGVRVTNLSQSLANLGFPTHLFFIGDPRLKGEETLQTGAVLHRWCQWISHYHPNGVYQGEFEKIFDFNRSVPGYIIDNIVRPAIARGKIVAILGEEWHTAEAMIYLSDRLHEMGLRNRVVMFWNANNTFGFDRIDWGRLAFTNTITTVSRYMKNIILGLGRGLHPLVIPNGIPGVLLHRMDNEASAELRARIPADVVLSKVARWDEDKRWDTVIDTVARLKERGKKPVLLARGGIEPYGNQILEKARSLNLQVRDVHAQGNTMKDYFQAIENSGGADILSLKFHCPPELLRLFYHSSDAVLANSSHEPFGLVGLETMAAGGVAFTGNTGEDYAIPFHNSIVLETRDPREMVIYLSYLQENPDVTKKIRRMARETARIYTWERVVEYLIRKLEYRARSQGILANEPKKATPEPFIGIEPVDTEARPGLEVIKAREMARV
ncbi:MAG: hypothetical protein A2Z29_01710 [Chloroflexi bacterium RBG_16_56_11]|nr:MAG: hypothetical protein A2Z29_01710 [Chloroflexi bacterium RBG_16_56_11]